MVLICYSEVGLSPEHKSLICIFISVGSMLFSQQYGIFGSVGLERQSIFACPHILSNLTIR